MISMSFGFDNLVPEIQDAINYATFNRVIMFAAAANHGGDAKISYQPTKKRWYCVSTRRMEWVIHRLSLHHRTPRARTTVFQERGVESSWPKTFNLRSIVRKAGTSFVTPILVGVAATLLYYAQIKFPGSDARDKSRRAGSVGKMRTMLSEIT
jgi:hypothetical protein